MRIEDLAAKHAYDLPGYQLVFFEEVAFPVWKVNLRIQILEDRYLNVVDEFLLKLIDVGVGTIDQIAAILGLNNELIRESAIKMLSAEVIRFNHINQTMAITEKGKPVLELLKMSTPKNVPLSICVDGITGNFLPDTGRLLKSSQIKKIDLRNIHSSREVEKPTEGNFDLSKFKSFYKSLAAKGYPNLPKGELIDVLEVGRAWPLFKIMRVLTYYDADNDIHQFAVFDRNVRANEYDSMLQALDSSEDLGVLPLEDASIEMNYGKEDTISLTSKLDTCFLDAEKNQQELVAIEKELIKIENELDISPEGQPEQELLSEINRLNGLLEKQKTTTRLLRTYEHRPLLEKSFESARQWVVIVSPWLDPVALNESLVTQIDKSLQRKVQVVILYGYPGELEHYKKQKQDIVLHSLNRLKEKKHGKYLHIKDIGITHEKVLICDKKFIIVGSFNWLSFKGDKLKGLRLEKSVYTEEVSVIEDAFIDIIKHGNLDKNFFK